MKKWLSEVVKDALNYSDQIKLVFHDYKSASTHLCVCVVCVCLRVCTCIMLIYN